MKNKIGIEQSKGFVDDLSTAAAAAAATVTEMIIDNDDGEDDSVSLVEIN